MKIVPGLLHVLYAKPAGPLFRQKEHSPIVACGDGFVRDGIDGFVGGGCWLLDDYFPSIRSNKALILSAVDEYAGRGWELYVVVALLVGSGALFIVTVMSRAISEETLFVVVILLFCMLLMNCC